jgi:hypothetical protein
MKGRTLYVIADRKAPPSAAGRFISLSTYAVSPRPVLPAPRERVFPKGRLASTEIIFAWPVFPQSAGDAAGLAACLWARL